MQLQIIGLCRFSLLSYGGFQDMPEDVEARRAKLFDEARLARRMAWFEAITLPTIKAQKDQDFIFLVVTSDELPDPYLSRLHQIAADLPPMRVLPLPIGKHREQCADAITALIDPSADRVIQFRLDDDDGVAQDFTAQLRWRARQMARLLRNDEPFGLDFQRGLVLTPQAEGLGLKMVHAQFWTPGLAYVLPPRAKNTVLDYFHHRVWRHMSTIGLPHIAMFIRGDHAENDSGELTGQFEIPFKTTILRKQLAERFQLNADEVAERLCSFD